MNILYKKSLIAYYYLKTRRKQFKNSSEIACWQHHCLQKFQQTILRRSPYYRQFCERSFAEIPIMNKKQHMENFDLINTCNAKLENIIEIAALAERTRNFTPKYKALSVGFSSGTSGNRGVFLTSELKQAMWAGTLLAKVNPTILKKQKIALFLRANNNLYETIHSTLFDFNFFDLLGDWDQLLKKCNQYQPTMVIAPAKVLSLLAKAQGDNININPAKIISIAEVLTENDQSLIEASFRQKVHQIYQCTEGFLAHTCQAGNLHLNEDIVYFEKNWLDKATNRFNPIVTDLNRYMQPIVRYQMNDILILDPVQCPCGSPLTRISKIEGRCDDIFYLSNGNQLVNIFPDFISRAILAASAALQDFRIAQVAYDKLIIYLSPNEPAIQTNVVSELKLLWNRFAVDTPNYEFKDLHIGPLHQKQRRVVRLLTVGKSL